VQTLAVVALFAEGTTIIRNVPHIRHKETDRIAAVATELRKLGATVVEHPDGLEITPGRLRPAGIATYNDHRMAMSFAIAGLVQPGVVIHEPGCTVKTYPRFFEALRSVTALQS
jgi:3-phosphoshikimate 1-carboxyvinyltransferase